MDARIPRGHACRIHSRRPSPVLGLTQPPSLPSRQFIRHFIRQPGVKPVRRLCACLCSLAKNDCAKAHPLRCAGLGRAIHIILIPPLPLSLTANGPYGGFCPLKRTPINHNTYSNPYYISTIFFFLGKVDFSIGFIEVSCLEVV